MFGKEAMARAAVVGSLLGGPLVAISSCSRGVNSRAWSRALRKNVVASNALKRVYVLRIADGQRARRCGGGGLRGSGALIHVRI